MKDKSNPHARWADEPAPSIPWKLPTAIALVISILFAIIR